MIREVSGPVKSSGIHPSARRMSTQDRGAFPGILPLGAQCDRPGRDGVRIAPPFMAGDVGRVRPSVPSLAVRFPRMGREGKKEERTGPRSQR